ncbi:MAG: hypothetical protein KBF93_13595 [Leptospiraceae bacterium]|nr:hypothetical protein [Leptospiraceae bacterium]
MLDRTSVRYSFAPMEHKLKVIPEKGNYLLQKNHLNRKNGFYIPKKIYLAQKPYYPVKILFFETYAI